MTEAALEEKRLPRNRLAALLGRRLKTVHIRNKRGGRKQIELGRSNHEQGRVVIFAKKIEDVAQADKAIGYGKNWGRRVAADETTRHEIRHFTSNNEEKVKQYSRKKTWRKHGGRIVG